MSERVPSAFLRVLSDLTGWLETARVPSMVIGGVAASILGRPRATRDIDALAFLPEHRWAGVLADAQTHGIVARIDEPLEFARRTRVLLLRHVASAVDIDVIFGRLPYEEEAIAHGEMHDLGGVQLKLPQVEDLLIMKAIAQRPQDLRDIEGLLDVHPGADIERVRRWVREFAMAMAMPDMLESFERLLNQRRVKRQP